MGTKQRVATIGAIGVVTLALALIGAGVVHAAAPFAAGGKVLSADTATGTPSIATSSGAALDDATIADVAGLSGDAGITGQAQATGAIPEWLRERALYRVRMLVHADVTLNLPQRGILQVRADHGTVSSIQAGSITLAEADGSTPSLNTDSLTRLRKGGAPQPIGALAVHDEVVVLSLNQGTNAPLARLIVVLPAE